MPTKKESRLMRAGYRYQNCAFIDIARAICSDFELTLDELGAKPAVFVDAVGERVVIKVERTRELFDHPGIGVKNFDDTEVKSKRSRTMPARIGSSSGSTPAR